MAKGSFDRKYENNNPGKGPELYKVNSSDAGMDLSRDRVLIIAEKGWLEVSSVPVTHRLEASCIADFRLRQPHDIKIEEISSDFEGNILLLDDVAESDAGTGPAWEYEMGIRNNPVISLTPDESILIERRMDLFREFYNDIDSLFRHENLIASFRILMREIISIYINNCKSDAYKSGGVKWTFPLRKTGFLCVFRRR